MDIEQLFSAVVRPQIRKKYIYRPSVIKDCKTKEADVQIPSSSTDNN